MNMRWNKENGAPVSLTGIERMQLDFSLAV